MSGQGRRRIDEIGDESRRRILDAAEALFAERGFERTSFVDVAERSGISRGSIPWHFKNKAGLLMAVVERAVDQSMSREAYDSLPTLSVVLADYADWVREGNSALLFMILTEAMSTEGTVHTQYQEFLTQRRAGLESWLRAQRPEGADPARAKEQERTYAVMLIGAVWGVHLQALIDPGNVDLDQAFQLIAAEFQKNLATIWDAPPSQAPAVPSARNNT